MAEKDDLQTLERVVSKYSIVLMDTSVISHYLGGNQNPISIEEKMIVLEENHQCRIVLIDYLNKGLPCFMTSSVLEELQVGDHYNYKKMIKRASSYKNARLIPKAGSDKAKELLELRRKIKNAQKERRKLIITFQENDRVLELNRNEIDLYNLFYKAYSGLLSLYKLSEVDFDLLVSGAVIAQTRESSALVSNDIRGIAHAWNYILRKEKISLKKFGFVNRKGINDFEILQ